MTNLANTLLNHVVFNDYLEVIVESTSTSNLSNRNPESQVNFFAREAYDFICTISPPVIPFAFSLTTRSFFTILKPDS